MPPIRRALLSVTDKAGLAEFAHGLCSHGVEIISTGGTAALLRSAGVPVIPIEHVTNFPEIMHGRVKTLHPKVHGGLLALRDHPEHIEAMKRHEIAPIDLVCVNLYAFEATCSKPGCTREEAIEHIDIGGPSMIRSAAKNHAFVTVVTRPADYGRVLADMASNGGDTTPALRAELAAEAFATTARYDAAIAAYLAAKPAGRCPPLLSMHFVRVDELRYGENPHQSAALYRDPGYQSPGIARAEQLHGKELSYNNINDGAAALSLVGALRSVFPTEHAACVVKHTNPCGAAIASSPRDAIDEAIAGDPVAAFGGIVACGSVVDEEAAARLCAKDAFFEVVIAPGYTPGALSALRGRWTNLRILAVGELTGPPPHEQEWRSIPGGALVQERDTKYGGERVHAAGPAPGKEQERAAAFLEVVGRSLFSNAVVLGGPSPSRAGAVRMFGAGAGQMDRVTSCRLAVEKAGPLARGAVAYSDAFFPFADGPAILADAGVSVIVHPGGSKRDQDTFDLCKARGVCCLTTGVRHFRH
ncbi:MAG: bifunctional phosphoribosylaminoimidazolecarboxamide formyltransferase/IMP cyclohydrolase [Phycisphaerae bacterium]|nr:bifunctional phosphoribosylaminoimidazolecarboxamide formyltransferase/IMP cyclohydrolase [Phycisphaerae bacterium]